MWRPPLLRLAVPRRVRINAHIAHDAHRCYAETARTHRLEANTANMARVNISIPDSLYARLHRLRDRVNASKVCAIALEKELDMIEGQTLAPDVDEAKVERLVERLRHQQSERDRWFRRGREAGETWAQESATLQELSATLELVVASPHYPVH